MNEIAKLYISRDGKTYRLKVFTRSISIERQPNGENVLVDRPAGIYKAETEAWGFEVIEELITRYEAGTLIEV